MRLGNPILPPAEANDLDLVALFFAVFLWARVIWWSVTGVVD